MFFSKVIYSAVVLAGIVSGHSWLECSKVTSVDTNPAIVANVFTPMNIKCEGYPRAKYWNGDWIEESKNYLWKFDDGKACAPGQRQPIYPNGLNMATARPGETIRLRHWGNGHSERDRANPPRDPGVLRIYWGGRKEFEIENASQLTDNLKIAEAGFADDALIVDDNLSATKRNERGNFFNVKLPDNMETGRHMFVWAWGWKWNAFTNRFDNEFGTCFDINIVGGSNSPPAPRPVPENNRQVQTVNAGAQGGAPPAVSDKCDETCFKGGNTAWPCTGKHCPSCRYVNAGTHGCYDKQADGTCPFKGGYDCSTGTSL